MVGASYPAVLLAEPVQTMLNLPEVTIILTLSAFMYFGIGICLCRLFAAVSQYRYNNKLNT